MISKKKKIEAFEEKKNEAFEKKIEAFEKKAFNSVRSFHNPETRTIKFALKPSDSKFYEFTLFFRS